MSEQNQLSQVEQIFLTLQTKLEDTTWTETQDPEFIKALGDVRTIINNLAGELQTFMAIYYEYTRLIAENMMLVPGPVDDAQDVEGIPTQTSEAPAPANRAERRARKTPLNL
jgi:hypothetical protein